MTSPQKAKGSAYEREVAVYLRDNGFPQADRRYGAGVQYDKGDLVGVPDVTIECKNHAKIDLAQFIDEAIVEAGHARTKYGVAVIKRRRHNVAQSYVVMTLEQFTLLLQERLALGPVKKKGK
jgi:Holliday junction resolvase